MDLLRIEVEKGGKFGRTVFEIEDGAIVCRSNLGERRLHFGDIQRVVLYGIWDADIGRIVGCELRPTDGEDMILSASPKDDPVPYNRFLVALHERLAGKGRNPGFYAGSFLMFWLEVGLFLFLTVLGLLAYFFEPSFGKHAYKFLGLGVLGGVLLPLVLLFGRPSRYDPGAIPKKFLALESSQ